MNFELFEQGDARRKLAPEECQELKRRISARLKGPALKEGDYARVHGRFLDGEAGLAWPKEMNKHIGHVGRVVSTETRETRAGPQVIVGLKFPDNHVWYFVRRVLGPVLIHKRPPTS